MITPDYRAMCAEFVERLDRRAMKSRKEIELIDSARALLAAPEAVGVTDEELLAQKAYVAFVQICKGGSDDAGTYDADEELVRRALKRLDALESTTHPAPVPVGERLPGEGDCDAEGMCWWFEVEDYFGCDLPCWTFTNAKKTWGSVPPITVTHWLPHWALPLPGVE